MMRTTLLGIFGLAFLCVRTIGAEVPWPDKLIQSYGQYSLDRQGSLVTIARDSEGASVTVECGVFGDQSTASVKDCPQGVGWAVYVESPVKVWVYNGRLGGALIEFEPKRTSTSALTPGHLLRCPEPFWAVLPEAVREKYRVTEADREEFLPNR